MVAPPPRLAAPGGDIAARGAIPGVTFEVIGLVIALTSGLRSYPHLEPGPVEVVASARRRRGSSVVVRF